MGWAPRCLAAAAATCLLGLAGASAPTLAHDEGPPPNPWKEKLNRFVPKKPGTKETTRYWFGPYTVPPGHDANRIDIDLPVHDGFMVAVEPGMRRVADLSEPSHQEAHIHHAHWFALDPGNKEDNYTYGNTEWIFGNGDEETKANFEERSAADPDGPIYGQYVGAAGPQLMIYMLHNKTAQPLVTWIVLDLTFIHGTKAQLAKLGGRRYHDVSGVLFGRTFDVPRQITGDGIFETTRDQPKPIEWTSTMDGTLIGTGGHLHPGGLRVVVENFGSKANPCPDDGRGYGGTQLLRSEALFRRGLFSEDFQMEVTHPAFRAPIHKGDRIRITGVYENRDHAWYDVMTHEGLYIDEAQPPKGRCKPYLVGGVQERRMKTKRVRHRHFRIDRAGKLRSFIHVHRKRVPVGVDPTAGVPNRPWGHHDDLICGPELGARPCERPETPRPPGRTTNTVTIANFFYVPGDMSFPGADGAPVRVKRGTPLTFVNADQPLGIRHTVTTCPWPCNGGYVANYPFPDGRWDSGTLGYDPIDGGNTNPVSSTPSDLAVGKYAYFCRIHPWMRGAFEVVQ
jgi:plastocyanin